MSSHAADGQGTEDAKFPGRESALRQEIDAERGRLVQSVESLRGELERAKRGPSVRAPHLAAVAAVGFVVAGGVEATIRWLGVRERRRRLREPSDPLRRLAGRIRS